MIYESWVLASDWQAWGIIRQSPSGPPDSRVPLAPLQAQSGHGLRCVPTGLNCLEGVWGRESVGTSDRMGFRVLVMADTGTQVGLVAVQAVNAFKVSSRLACSTDHLIVLETDEFSFFQTGSGRVRAQARQVQEEMPGRQMPVPDEPGGEPATREAASSIPDFASLEKIAGHIQVSLRVHLPCKPPVYVDKID